ncbi:MAG TPA: VIT1/CCC1 transporter family protein [Tepidiformaceae bacterium]|nr:VIT1/CCC1 transporter family protein [Thermoflexaceae bacterium]HMS58751.1 VIT1/CCC1 transporter family protein [Tepidiformaceae bacterium]
MPSDTPSRVSPDDIKRYRSNLRDEVDGAALYHLLAAAEKDPGLREVYQRLAVSEERHKELWAAKLREAGAPVPDFKPSRRVRVLGWLARRFGTHAVAPIVTAMEVDATGMYDNQPEAVAANLPAEERSHARLFRELSRGHAGATSAGSIARLEGRHRGSSGNALRAAVLGVNDGLVSNLSLVMGVAGADPGRDVVFLAGLAGLLAGAFSMALGEWISVRSSAESFERQMAIEREELEFLPEEEEEELTLIYQAKGLPREDAALFASHIMKNKESALDTLAREELGMSPDEAGNAWVAAITSFVLFVIGAAVPLLPWMFGGGAAATAASAIAAGAALFLAGAVTTLFTGRGVLFSGGRMLVFGLSAAGLTFVIGRIIGVSTTG